MSDYCYKYKRGKEGSYVFCLEESKHCCNSDHLLEHYRCMDCFRIKTSKRKLEKDESEHYAKAVKSNKSYEFFAITYFSWECCSKCIVRNRHRLTCYEPFSETYFKPQSESKYYKIYEPYTLQALAKRVIRRLEIKPDLPPHTLKKLKIA